MTIVEKIFLSCIKASELVEKSHYFKLTSCEKLQLKLHMLICKPCVNYKKQSLLLEKGLEKQLKNIERLERNKVEIDLSKLKEEITEKINRNK